MRPHSLRMTAFGPYATTVDVDLDRLADAGLFLLHGPTGAGKTTLLDGIGFALFGRVPGARGEVKRLRSDHAEAGLRTEVQLEATLLGRRLRVTRSPAWERAKTRGVGTTTEQARVQLEELVAGDWVTLSTRAGEADQEIADLVGMSAEQFFQVVLLPQGDFAKFLRSDSKDRAALLQRLFTTERFADVEEWLARRRRTTAETVAAARAEISRVVARLAEVAGGQDPVDVPETVDVPWAQGLLTEAQALESASAARVSSCTRARDACRAELDAAVALQGRQQRRSGALVREQQLQLARPAVLALQVEADAVSRAVQVTGALAAVTERRGRRDASLHLQRAARDALAQVAPDLIDLVDAPDLRAALGREQERAGRLGALDDVDLAHRTAADEASRARDEQADALAAVAEAEIALAVLPVRRAEITVLLDGARTAATEVPTLRAARSTLLALRPEVLALGQQTTQERLLRDQVLSARESAVALGRKAVDLRVANVNSMIARLAANLTDGVPCDVCGSAEHPDPSALRDEGVSTDDEDRARRAADLADEEVSRLQAEHAAVQATLRALADRVGEHTLASVDQQVAELDLQLGVLEQSVARLAQAEAELASIDAQRIALGEQHVAQTARADHAARRFTEATLRADQALARLHAELGDDLPLGLDAARARTDQRVAALTELLAAVEQTSARADELARAVAEAETACTAAGFASTDDAGQALRDQPWRDEAAGRLRAHADAAAAVAFDLADPALDVALDPVAPVEATTEALAQADAALTAAAAEHGQARQRRTALDRLVPELAGLLTDLAPLEQRATEARQLADLCAGTGANALKMTLSSFVLAARLEEVAEAASGRLLRMTQGRYTLVHTDGAARGNQRSGLGLLVRDGWSGHDRDTSTLSGGETFLAALALALGLADVVAAEAGGARLGALFIDEGFGTLDEETLDEVMDVLDGLREGGRIVGLVSHVSDLKQRIPAQVQVTKTRTGSALALLGC